MPGSAHPQLATARQNKDGSLLAKALPADLGSTGCPILLESTVAYRP